HSRLALLEWRAVAGFLRVRSLATSAARDSFALTSGEETLMSKRFPHAFPIALLLLLALPAGLRAAELAPQGDHYFVAPLSEIEWQGEVSETMREILEGTSISPDAARPWLRIEGEGEVYVDPERPGSISRIPDIDVTDPVDTESIEEADD